MSKGKQLVSWSFFRFLLVLYLLSVTTVTSNICSAGLIAGKCLVYIYLDSTLDMKNFREYGTAKLNGNNPFLNTAEGHGAIWNNLLIKPQSFFEIVLKVSIGPDSTEKGWANDGFSIQIAKSPGYLNAQSYGGSLGYSGQRNAMVLEVDLYKNSDFNDIDDESISFHNCSVYACGPYEDHRTTQTSIPGVSLSLLF